MPSDEAIDGQHPAGNDVAADSSKGETVKYNSLNCVEKEVLEKKLTKDLVKGAEGVSGGCSDFCSWILDQFRSTTAKPPSQTLFAAIEYLKEHCGSEGLFGRNADEEQEKEYYNVIRNGDELVLEEHVDVYALGIATIKYITEDIIFFDESVYKRLGEAYQANNASEVARIMRRIPFIIANREVVIELQDFRSRIEGLQNEKGSDRFLDAFSKAIIKCKAAGGEDAITNEMKKAIFIDLLNGDFVNVPMKYYQ